MERPIVAFDNGRLSIALRRGILPPLQVTLTPHGEELLKDQLARNTGSSPEEILERALETLAGQAPPERRKTTAEAVAHIRESRKGVTLGGLKIKDLIHEGHKY